MRSRESVDGRLQTHVVCGSFNLKLSQSICAVLSDFGGVEWKILLFLVKGPFDNIGIRRQRLHLLALK